MVDRCVSPTTEWALRCAEIESLVFVEVDSFKYGRRFLVKIKLTLICNRRSNFCPFSCEGRFFHIDCVQSTDPSKRKTLSGAHQHQWFLKLECEVMFSLTSSTFTTANKFLMQSMLPRANKF